MRESQSKYNQLKTDYGWNNDFRIKPGNYDITSKDEIEGVFMRNNLYPSKYIKIGLLQLLRKKRCTTTTRSIIINNGTSANYD